jgi:hypothetical protein
MTIATLEQFKDFIRELSTDLDSPFQLALESASSEANNYLGFIAEEEFPTDGPPSDVVIACCLLAQVHADSGDPDAQEYRRRAAQRLMQPYRLNTGIGSA